jgi:flagellar hook-associated protein 1 FlgK
MNTTNLPWTVKNGTFEVKVKDTATGLVKTSTIAVQIGIDGSDTTLASLASDLDAVANLSASIDAGGHLVLSSDANFTFSFSAPSSGDATDALAVLGINTYFTGKSAYDINVSSTLKSDQSKIGASATGEPINGAVAGAIAALGITEVDSMNGQSVSEFFTSMVGQIAAESKAAQDNYAAADVVVQTLESERQSISGVSLDEEAIHMIMFQRAFQGASRYVNVVDQMLDEILNLVRY